MKVIYKKELKGYFNGMMGYVFAAFALIVIGIYTFAVNLSQSYPNFEYALDSCRFVFLLLIPMLTMRAISEERRQRTDQLLYSSPVSTWGVIWGKFLASLTVFALPLAVSCAYPLILSRFGQVNLKSAYAGIFGFLLMGGACIAIGIFLSALTDSQMVAAVMCFGALVLCYLMPSLANMVSASAFTSFAGFSLLAVAVAYVIYSATGKAAIAGGIGGGCIVALGLIYYFKSPWLEGALNRAMNSLSLFSRFNYFVYGIFDLNTVLYFGTIILLFLFFTVQVIEKRRWS